MYIELSSEQMDMVWDAINFTMRDYEGVESKEWMQSMAVLKEIFDTDD